VTDVLCPCVQGIYDGSVYQHYKGGRYQVEGFAVDTSTGGWLVLYREVGVGPGHPYARAAEEWFQMVDADGTTRFTEIQYGR
jgi:hypothetical protein